MSFLGVMLRTGLRHRWRSWLALSLLVAVVVGLVLAGAQTARRTATALPRFEASHGYDVFAYAVNPLAHVASLPGVAASVHLLATGSGAPSCTSCTDQINSNDFSLQEVAPSQLTKLVKLESGRLPDQSDPEQVLASENLARFGVHVGTVVHLPLVSSAQRAAVFSNSNVTPSGPTVTLRVVGMETTEYEFPTNATPAYDMYTTSAFARKYNAQSVVFNEYVFRLRGGTNELLRFESALRSSGAVGSEDLSAVASSIQTSIDPQVVGWWILTGLAALVGVIVLAQALARQDAIDSEDFPTLRSVGSTRRQLFALTMVRTVLLALVGVIGAVILAAGLSTFTPVGEARLAEPDPGFQFDPLLLVGGAAVALCLVVVLGIWPAARAARPSRSGDESVIRPSRIVGVVTATGAPPSALIGVRNALERGRGRSAVPVSSALVACVLAVTTLCGAAVFSSSLTRLTSTPAWYGQGFDAWFSPNTTGSVTQNQQLLKALERPGIASILVGVSGAVTVNGTVLDALAGQTIRGGFVMTSSTGVGPTGTDQVLLGSKTMRQLGVHVGSTVRVAFPSPGKTQTRSGHFTVVGTTVLPPDFNPRGGLGTGAIFSLAAFVGHECPPGADGQTCLVSAALADSGAFLVRTTPGPEGKAALATLSRAYPSQVNIPSPPTNLVNFGEAVNFPLILSLVVALFGIGALLHLLLTSLHRRRRETGLLKSLGMLRRQIAYCVSWQTTTVAVIGIGLGVPLGVAAGRLVWAAFATNLGVVASTPEVTVAVLVAIGLGTLIVANALAVVPALLAARARPASLLRSE